VAAVVGTVFVVRNLDSTIRYLHLPTAKLANKPELFTNFWEKERAIA
jgi:hypothetical protein